MTARPALPCLALLPLLLLGCKSGGAAEPAPAGAAPPAAETAPSAAPAALQHETTPTITASGQLGGHLGQRVHLVGRADNAKLSAVVMVGQAPIYCLGLTSWPDALRTKLVRATGTLVQTDRYQARVDDGGAISQGTAGGDLVLEGCSYTEAR